MEDAALYIKIDRGELCHFPPVRRTIEAHRDPAALFWNVFGGLDASVIQFTCGTAVVGYHAAHGSISVAAAGSRHRLDRSRDSCVVQQLVAVRLMIGCVGPRARSSINVAGTASSLVTCSIRLRRARMDRHHDTFSGSPVACGGTSSVSDVLTTKRPAAPARRRPR